MKERGQGVTKKVQNMSLAVVGQLFVLLVVDCFITGGLNSILL